MMQVLILFLSIVLAGTASNNPQEEMLRSNKDYHNMNPHPPIASQTYTDPIPSNFTYQGRYTMSSDGGRQFIYSPDDNWIAYRSSEDYRNYVFFRSRNSNENFNRISIGSASIYSLGFSQDSKFLFVATNNGIFYACKFSANMNVNDCKSSVNLGQTFNNVLGIKIQTNFANKIVVTDYTRVWIINYSSLGNLQLETKIDYVDDKCYVYRIKWHPLAEKDVLILAGYNFSSSDKGFISIYNITSRTFFNFSTPLIRSFDVLKDRQNLLACTDDQVIQFGFSLTSITKIGILMNQGCPNRVGDTSISEDGSLFFAKLAKTYLNRPLQVFIVNQSSQVSQQKHNSSSNDLSNDKSFNNHGTSNVTLKLLTQLFNCSDDEYVWGTSLDGNDVLFSNKYGSYFERYSLCLNDTFYSNYQCLKCSSNCSTCHFNESFCLTCAKSSYTPVNGVCVKCSDFLPGCLQCSSSSVCLTCNKIQNWSQTPVNGVCVCQDYFYDNLNGTCVLCDPLKRCVTCINSSACLKCDISKGCLEIPVDGTCICPSSFSLKVEKQLSCGIDNCKMCLMQNVCFGCEESTTFSDGICLKKSIWAIVLYVAIGLAVILVGILALNKYRMRKTLENQSSLLEGNGMRLEFDGERAEV